MQNDLEDLLDQRARLLHVELRLLRLREQAVLLRGVHELLGDALQPLRGLRRCVGDVEPGDDAGRERGLGQRSDLPRRERVQPHAQAQGGAVVQQREAHAVQQPLVDARPQAPPERVDMASLPVRWGLLVRQERIERGGIVLAPAIQVDVHLGERAGVREALLQRQRRRVDDVLTLGAREQEALRAPEVRALELDGVARLREHPASHRREALEQRSVLRDGEEQDARGLGRARLPRAHQHADRAPRANPSRTDEWEGLLEVLAAQHLGQRYAQLRERRLHALHRAGRHEQIGPSGDLRAGGGLGGLGLGGLGLGGLGLGGLGLGGLGLGRLGLGGGGEAAQQEPGPREASERGAVHCRAHRKEPFGGDGARR